MNKVKFTDLHLHSEFSMQDGMIRIADYKDPKHIKSEIVLRAEDTGSPVITITDHGNMHCAARLASVCKTFGFRYMPGCEFYLAPNGRFSKSVSNRGEAYVHINSWAINKQGYSNMCMLQKLSNTEGFYYVPRIDKELIEKYHKGILWSDACAGGTISSLILADKIEEAYKDFMWYMELLKDDFYIEYHNHGLADEEKVNSVKLDWAKRHGIPIIACTDAHYTYKEDTDTHRALLCCQYGKSYDDPTFGGFGGDGYWLLSEDELLERYPVEYLNNTRDLAERCEDKIIEFGDVITPEFKIPQWFIDKVEKGEVTV